MAETDIEKDEWWKSSVAYQIYPRSFFDSDGNGIGDINGIRTKLDYLVDLGVDVIWTSPFYPSPGIDSGYDISDYRSVDPDLGTLADFERLISEAHERNLKVIVDFVPNHTSDQHPWFEESKSSKDNPKRDYYVWQNGKNGSEPNNWLSLFGGSAWQLDEQTGQYYLHSFAKEQPDLNWKNPEVRKQMRDVVDFWLDKGADGLRVDAVSWLSKDPALSDDPINPNYKDGMDPYHQLIHDNSCGGPELFNYLNEIAELCAMRGDRFMITEAYPDLPVSAEQQTGYYLQFYDNLDYRHCAPFNFGFTSAEWDAETYRHLIEDFQSALLPGQPQMYAMGNHDRSRLASRLGPSAARAAATLLLSLPGMPFIYNGDEIGMANAAEAAHAGGDPGTDDVGFNRQVARSPMQWSAEPNAGFSKAVPWLPVASNFAELNVAQQSLDQKSSLSLYKELLRLRRGSPALSIGDCRTFRLEGNVLGFSRTHMRDRKTVILNFSETSAIVESTRIAGHLVLSSYLDSEQPDSVSGRIELRANEAVIIDASA